MTKRSNEEVSRKWVTKNSQKYWCITVANGYDALTGKQKRKE